MNILSSYSYMLSLSHTPPQKTLNTNKLVDGMERWFHSKNICYLYRGSRFGPQHPNDSSQPPETSVSGTPTSSSGLHRYQAYIWYNRKTLMHIKNI